MRGGSGPLVPDRLARALSFVFWFSLLGVLARLAVWERVDYVPLQAATVILVSLLLLLSGHAVSVLGNVIIARHAGTTMMIDVIPDCTGWKAMTAMAALVLATPGRSLRAKILGLAVLVPLGFALNSIRLATTIMVSLRFGTELFPLVHDVLWQGVMLLLVFGSWVAWYRITLPTGSGGEGKSHKPRH